MSDLVGSVLLNRYRIDASVGQGGMANVYKAWDASRAAFVAIKLLNADLAEDYVFLRRFAREARTLARLEHPNIVRFFSFEESRDHAFLVMEFVEGITLRRYLRLLRRPLTLPEALYVVEPISSALHYAHQMRVYHCDVKPANVFIDRGGRVVLADFGVARVTESATSTLATAGTPAYMAPEQCQGRPVDARTDIYSLGIAAYEMLTLDRPFKGDTHETTGSRAERVRWEQIYMRPPSPRRSNPVIPLETERAILTALEKDPRRRPQRVLAFCRDLSNDGKIRPVARLPEVKDPEMAAQAVPRPGVSPKEPDASRPMPWALAWANLSPATRGGLVAFAAILIIGLLVLALVRPLGPVDVTAPTGPMSSLLPGHYSIGRWSAYSLSDLCSGQPFGNLVFTVESVDVLSTGELRFNVSWTWRVTEMERNNCPSGSPVIYSDEGNVNMYITDDTGRRYDHTAVGDGAKREKLMAPNVAQYGWFLFPPPAVDARMFAFYDDDAGSVIRGIDLRP